METLINLGKQIATQREKLRLNQTDVASITGISDKTVRAIEQGKETVAMKNWLLVANIVGFDLQLQIKKMSDETRKSL